MSGHYLHGHTPSAPSGRLVPPPAPSDSARAAERRPALLHACRAAADMEIGPETTIAELVRTVVDALADAGLLVGTRKAPDDAAIERAIVAVNRVRLLPAIALNGQSRSEAIARAALAAAEEVSGA